MDALVQSIVLHADAAIRQLPAAQQAEAVEALRVRIEERSKKSEGRLRYEAMGCEGKVRHVDQVAADDVRRRHRDSHRLRAYRCDNCGFWHLGHRRRT